jgi:hypothetical protein
LAGDINNKYGVTVSAYVDECGELGALRWLGDCANLEAFEKVKNQLIVDKGHTQKVSPVAELFIEGSFYDTVMRAL